MSKVMMFARTFPAYHLRKGEPTYFVEKIWVSLGSSFLDQLSDEERLFNPRLSLDEFNPKHHTIREGHRFKVGDWFSPRVWSGKPYQSKQIIIAPDIQVKKVWLFEISNTSHAIDGFLYNLNNLKEVAKNDGLEVADFELWFKLKPGGRFVGQIISWNDQIEYYYETNQR